MENTEEKALQKKEEADLINNMPDSILRPIIALLPIIEAVRTSQLSSRWKDLWKSMPYLHFDPETIVLGHINNDDPEVFMKEITRTTRIVDHVVTNHRSSLKSCRIIHSTNHCSSGDVERWIKHLYITKKIEELALTCVHLRDSDKFRWLHHLPVGIFHSGSLRALELKNYVLKDASLFKGSCNIKALTLESVHLKILNGDDDDYLRTIISNCRFLERLRMKGCTGLQNLMIHDHENLKNLELETLSLMGLDIQAVNLETLVIENIACPSDQIKFYTPNLMFFRAYYTSSLVRILSHDHLTGQINQKDYRCITSMEIIERCIGIYAQIPHERYGNVEYTSAFQNLQKISINMNMDYITHAIKLSLIFKVCLRLQEIYIHIKIGGEDRTVLGSKLYHLLPVLNPNYWEKMELCDSIKRVEIRSFRGEVHEMEFVKHLINKARMLKRLMIQLHVECSREVVEATRRSLLSLPKASLNVSIRLKHGDSYLSDPVLENGVE